MNWNRRTATLAGLALLALTNAVALGGAAYNRSGPPEATLQLGERELGLPPDWSNGSEENSGLALRLNWRTLPALSGRAGGPSEHQDGRDLADDGGSRPAWLDAKKMAALGLPSTPPMDLARERWRVSHEVLVVLEMDGPACQEAARRAAAYAQELEARDASARESAEIVRDNETRLGSRLFAIDAGLDAVVLRDRYPDRKRYAIVHARVRPRYVAYGQPEGGSIEGFGPVELNVPLTLRQVFVGMRHLAYRAGGGPDAHFEATVAFGQRLEPWLVAAVAR